MRTLLERKTSVPLTCPRDGHTLRELTAASMRCCRCDARIRLGQARALISGRDVGKSTPPARSSVTFTVAPSGTRVVNVIRRPVKVPARRTAQPRELGLAALAVIEMLLETRAIVTIEGIEGIEGGKLVEVVSHSDPEPHSPGRRRRFGPGGFYSNGWFWTLCSVA